MKKAVISCAAGTCLALSLLAACAHHDAVQPTRAAQSDARNPLSQDHAAGQAMAQGQALAQGEEPPAPLAEPPAAAINTSGDAGAAAARAADPNGPTVEVELAEKSPLAPPAPGADPSALDQGNDEADLRITQSLRKAMMADGSLGLGAKSVVVVTRERHVVLRGTVMYERERATIEAKARAIAGVASVDDRIEVAPR